MQRINAASYAFYRVCMIQHIFMPHVKYISQAISIYLTSHPTAPLLHLSWRNTCLLVAAIKGNLTPAILGYCDMKRRNPMYERCVRSDI